MKEEENDQGFCQFCRILQNIEKNQSKNKNKNKNIIKIDQEFFSFHDIDKASAKQHILICTQKHIQSALDISSEQIDIFEKMRRFGIQSLKSLNQEYNQEQFRFGFHLKPHISVYHIHLHGFVLPFKSQLIQKMRYGRLLYSIQDIIQKIRLKQLVKL